MAGFLGSWHCAFMCGPVACYVTERKSLWPYQMGRLISYVLLGLLSGSISGFFINSKYGFVRYVSVFILIILLFVMLLSDRQIVRLPPGMSRFYFKYKTSGFMLGLFTVLLPCGWLYTFALSASAAGSAYGGGLVMFLFWVSTLPSLTIAQVFLKKMIDQTKNDRAKKISTWVLLISSIYSLIMFLVLHS